MSSQSHDLRPDEFYDIDVILEHGADKYAPHDWERPDAKTMAFPKNLDSMFHHLAREYVYQENRELIDTVRYLSRHAQLLIPTGLYMSIQELIDKLTVDKDSSEHHSLHLACRALMGYTRTKRRLK